MIKPPASYRPRTIQERLDLIRIREGLSSDYKLALFLGIGETALANYRKGRSLPDVDAALKISKALGEEPSVFLLEIEMMRAKTPGAKVAWGSAAALMALAQKHKDLLLGASGGGGKTLDITSAASTSPGGDPARGAVSSVRPEYTSHHRRAGTSSRNPVAHLVQWLSAAAAPAPRLAAAR